MKEKLAKQSRRFHARLLQPAFPAPSLFWLMIFRMTRTALKLTAREEMRDYVYYRDNGLFGSDYYYAVRLGLFKKAAGAFFDWAGARMFRPPKAAVALSSGGAA
jgi:hypothetical protein